jgi:hypothetical protein
LEVRCIPPEYLRFLEVTRMTTVVATHSMLVSESRVSEGNRHFHGTKLFRVGDSILGLCGDWNAALMFLEWFQSSKKRKDAPEFSEDDSFDALEVSPEGLFAWDHHCRRVEILSPHYSIGSGSLAALAALHLGTTPEQAVEAACAVDMYSSGPLQTLHLIPPSHGKPTSDNPKGRSRSPKARSRTPKK